jgi:integrase
MTKWSHSAGTKPHTVTVYERESGGTLYARAWDASAREGRGNWKRISLGHRDRKQAIRYATQEAAKLQKGEPVQQEETVTVARVFALYLKHHSPLKGRERQRSDERMAELWTRMIGADADPHTVTLEQWQRFIRDRASGAIDARGRHVPSKDRKPLRARSIEAGCKWLWFTFNWAVSWRLPSGRYLMRENPVRGFRKSIPKEKNPRCPVATLDYFEAVRAVAEQVPGYLPELLDIAEGTGRRISAILSLRYSDLRLERTEHAPYGAILWPAETDKVGKQWLAPISERVRAALYRVLAERPGVGTGFLFPALTMVDRPLSRSRASAWLVEAEKLAGVAHVPGQGWHSLRRSWATQRKHLPDVDVAAAGGWRSLTALKQSYQHADAAGVLAVVLGGGEVRQRAQ